MNIAKNKVVGIDYTLTDKAGKVLDSSTAHGPLYYIHGIGSLIPGLEAELDGKTTGAAFKVAISAKDAYGERVDDLCQVVSKTQFEIDGAGAVQVGMQFEVETEGGDVVVTVTHVEGDNVTVDGNHPLAGVELHFDVTVKEVREATSEELAHGHVHGPGGHHHH